MTISIQRTRWHASGWWGRLLGMLFFSLLILAGCNPGDENNAGTQDVASAADAVTIRHGEASYMMYCANCHDPEAEGFGDAVGNLTTLPSDLTTLKRDNGGEFPAERVYQSIDGRIDVEAHGPREMPVWGNVWPADEADQRISEIVAYIESIQKPI